MGQYLLNGLMTALHLSNFLYLCVGVTGGIVIGALPGLTATMGVAILLPFTFGMEPVTGLIMLVGIYIGAIYGGSISAILLNTPGTPAWFNQLCSTCHNFTYSCKICIEIFIPRIFCIGTFWANNYSKYFFRKFFKRNIGRGNWFTNFNSWNGCNHKFSKIHI